MERTIAQDTTGTQLQQTQALFPKKILKTVNHPSRVPYFHERIFFFTTSLKNYTMKCVHRTELHDENCTMKSFQLRSVFSNTQENDQDQNEI